MPQIDRWDNLPEGVRRQLRRWMESKPEVPTGDWYQDFGTFQICGKGSYPKTFLMKGQAASGEKL